MTPVWSRNDALFLVARRGDRYGVYQAAIFERREPTLLASFANFVALNDVSPDGRSLLLQQLDSWGHFDLMKLVFGQTSGLAPFLRTRFNEEQAQLSPDGRWLVSSDGKRFLMPARAETEIATPSTVVVNWTAALK
jgi:hypothetical protein